MSIREIIRLENAEYYADHGLYPEEREKGNHFIVNIEVETSLGAEVAARDAIEDTLNYEALAKIAEEEMKIPSNLLEHVAFRMLSRIREQFPEILLCKVK